MKFKLLLLATMPIAVYAQENTPAIKSEYPNTFSSGSAKVEKFTNASKRFNDWAISAGTGVAFVSYGDLTSFYDSKINWGWNAYLSLDKQISHTFGISLQYQIGETQQQGKLPGVYGDLAGVATANTTYRQLSVIGDLNLSNLMRRVDNHSKYRWALHAYAGMGLQGYKTLLLDNYMSTPTTKETHQIRVDQSQGLASFFYQGGIGLKYKVSRRFDIEARTMYIITGDDEFDGGGHGSYLQKGGLAYNRIKNNRSDNLWTVNLGVSVKLGKHISHLAWHDPLQEIYGKVYTLENKPTNLVVCEKGDKDNDGVCDDWDRQLDTPAGARVDGAGVALDVDLDGVIDLNDKCVTVPGPVENHGCPLTPAAKPAKPVITKVSTAAVEEVNKHFEGIEFALGKDVIRPQSFPKLNHAADIIKSLDRNDRYLVVGATDARGSAEMNLNLSQRRANAVVKYLVSKGVPSSMLKAEGRGKNDLKYPECDPATNCEEWKNEANRRVFFEVR